jgi:hypothetical protein
MWQHLWKKEPHDARLNKYKIMEKYMSLSQIEGK